MIRTAPLTPGLLYKKTNGTNLNDLSAWSSPCIIETLRSDATTCGRPLLHGNPMNMVG